MPITTRPSMPASYGLSQDEVFVPWSEAEAKLAAAHNFWLATVRTDGRPHVAPVWGLWLSAGFYFSTDARSAKARNLASNPHATLHLESGDDVVIVEGTVALADQVRADIAKRYLDRYACPIPDDSPLYVLRPDTAFAWTEKAFPTHATRYSFERKS